MGPCSYTEPTIGANQTCYTNPVVSELIFFFRTVWMLEDLLPPWGVRQSAPQEPLPEITQNDEVIYTYLYKKFRSYLHIP